MNQQEYVKKVYAEEYLIYRLAARRNIAPKILNCEPDENGTPSKGKFKLTTEKYPHTLRYYINNTNTHLPDSVYSHIRELIRRLHDIGILHGDINADNIVVNEHLTNIKIVGFSKSLYIPLQLSCEEDVHEVLSLHVQYLNINTLSNYSLDSKICTSQHFLDAEIRAVDNIRFL